MRRFARLLSVLLALPLLAYLVPVLWPDAAPSTETEAWLKPAESPPAAPRNGFPFLVGFGARDGERPAEEGERMVHDANSALAAAMAEDGTMGCQSIKLDSAWSRPPLAPSETLDKLCDPAEEFCLAGWRGEGEALEGMATEHRTLLDRYRRLRRFPRHVNTLRPHACAPFPSYVALLRIQRLQGALNVHRALNADGIEGFRGGLAALREDLAFARRLLTEADSLLAKMAAERMARRTLRSLAELMDDPRFDVAGGAPIAPLSTSERSLRLALRYEFRMTAGLLLAMKQRPSLADAPPFTDRLVAPLLKPGRSLNRIHHFYSEVATLSEQGVGRWSGIDDLRDRPSDWRDYLTNPLGTLMWELSHPSLRAPLARLIDLEGLITLTNLKRELLLAEVTRDQRPALLDHSDERFSAPYTGATALWDPDERSLGFPSRETEGELISVRLP